MMYQYFNGPYRDAAVGALVIVCFLLLRACGLL